MRVYADPGVKTHWHSHPGGQLLFVLDGVGQVQRQGGNIEEIRSGDAVWFAPDENHWHGASPQSPFSYVSIQPVRNGVAVHWMEPVSVISSTKKGKMNNDRPCNIVLRCLQITIWISSISVSGKRVRHWMVFPIFGSRHILQLDSRKARWASAENLYAPFYLWDDPEGANMFLTHPRF